MPYFAGAPLGIVKRTEQDFRDWVSTEAGFASTFCKYDDEPLKLEAYQMGFMMDTSAYRCSEKSRQTGYSFIFAIESLCRSHLKDTHTAIFVSYNLADAKEKIAYCKALHEELPLQFQKKLTVDSKLELGFRSNSATGRVSRIISNPSKAPRGKNGDIYLDELAHCANDREIYKGSTALILRSKGQLTVCSSPLGRRGMFWEIAREEIRPYNAYFRQNVPWWLCSEFCRDPKRAAKIAPGLSTEERVKMFGKKGIIDQFDSLLLEDFMQEFEVFYSDETLTFFPYELILSCSTLDPEDLAAEFADLNGAKGRLVAGFDVGRKKDLSELTVFESFADGRKRMRFKKSYDRVPFSEQEDDLRLLLNVSPVVRLWIDNTGMGMHLAENLKKEFPEIVEEVHFGSAKKELIATDFKIALQRKELELPNDRELIGQIHSIRKKVTPGGVITFEVEQNQSKGHADKFWSCALACQKERGGSGVGEVGVRILGG